MEEFRAYIYQTVADILSYFNSIATGEDFTTATVESVNITIPTPYTELELPVIEEAEAEETEAVTTEAAAEVMEALPATATINLIIYSCEGDE